MANGSMGGMIDRLVKCVVCGASRELGCLRPDKCKRKLKAKAKKVKDRWLKEYSEEMDGLRADLEALFPEDGAFVGDDVDLLRYARMSLKKIPLAELRSAFERCHGCGWMLNEHGDCNACDGEDEPQEEDPLIEGREG